jgi:hypothetical protein
MAWRGDHRFIGATSLDKIKLFLTNEKRTALERKTRRSKFKVICLEVATLLQVGGLPKRRHMEVRYGRHGR